MTSDLSQKRQSREPSKQGGHQAHPGFRARSRDLRQHGGEFPAPAVTIFAQPFLPLPRPTPTSTAARPQARRAGPRLPSPPGLRACAARCARRSGHRWRRRKAEARPLGSAAARPAPPRPTLQPPRPAALSCRAPPPTPRSAPLGRRAPRPGRLRRLPPRGRRHTPPPGRAFRGDSGPAWPFSRAERDGSRVCGSGSPPLHSAAFAPPPSSAPPLPLPRGSHTPRAEGAALGADKGQAGRKGLPAGCAVAGEAPRVPGSRPDSHWAAGAAWGRRGRARPGAGAPAQSPAPPRDRGGRVCAEGGRGQVTGPGTHPTPPGQELNLLFCSSLPLRV